MTYPVNVRARELLRKTKSHRFASLWRIERTDGQEFHFTDHDAPILFGGDVYSPAKSLTSTAEQAQASVREASIELEGALSSDKITFEDLHKRLFDDARVVHYLVDWKFADVVKEFRRTDFFIDVVRYDGARWVATVFGVSGLMRKQLGGVLTKACSHELGDAACNADGLTNLESATWKKTTTVATIVVDRRVFTIALAGLAPELFTNGRCYFSTGENAGVEVTVALSSGLGSPNPDRIYLWAKTPYPITVGDTVILRAGCNKLFNGDCITKFANGTNFGGRPHMPGTNEATPLVV